MMESTGELEVADRGGNVRVLRFNRPERLNALSDEIRERMSRAVVDAEQGGTIRVLVLEGVGRAFSVGADLKNPTVHASESISDSIKMFIPGNDIIPGSRLPMIAAVHGYCCGGGWEAAPSCDALLCTADAQLWG